MARVGVSGAVDEESRGRGDAALLTAPDVAFDPNEERRIVEIRREPNDVQVDGSSVGVEGVAMEHSHISKELVVHLPELPLPRRGLGGACGECRTGMFPAERKVAEDEAQSALELVEEPNEQRKGARAIQTLEIGVFDERHKSGTAAAHVIGIVHGADERRAAEERTSARREGTPAERVIILGMHCHVEVDAPRGAADGWAVGKRTTNRAPALLDSHATEP